MNDLFEKTFEPLSLDVVKALEQAWGMKFPKEYREFLLTVNGGAPKKTDFDIKDINNYSIVRCFFGLVPDRDFNFLYYLYRIYADRIPRNTLPVGDTISGNLILLSIRGQDYGKVYFWDHNHEVPNGQDPDYSNVSFLANSFGEFLNSLHPPREE